MLRLDVFLPDTARDETRVVQLPYRPGESARPVAFVEHYCDKPGCDCQRVVLRVHDLADCKVLATVAHSFDEPDEPDREPGQTSLDPLYPGGEFAGLMRGVVRHLLEHHDYQRDLEAHYEEFKEIVQRREEGASRPEIPEDTGRNDPCPCGSGRKFKKCCLRRQKQAVDDIPRRHDLALDEFRNDWRNRAESIERVDEFLEVVNAAQLAGNDQFDIAREMVEGLDVDLGRDLLLEKLQRGQSSRSIAETVANSTDGDFGDVPELLATILPPTVEALANYWGAETILPREIGSSIDSGYFMLAEDEPEVAWTNWAMAWKNLTTWLEENRELVGHSDLLEQLDDIFDADEPLQNWLHDLAEKSRELANANDENFGADKPLPDALEILEQIEETFADSNPAVANDAAVNRYYALLVLERKDEATELLESVVERPTDNLFAPLFLSDVYGMWGYEPTSTDLKLIVEFCELTIEQSDDEELSLLEEVHAELADTLDTMDAD